MFTKVIYSILGIANVRAPVKHKYNLKVFLIYKSKNNLAKFPTVEAMKAKQWLNHENILIHFS